MRAWLVTGLLVAGMLITGTINTLGAKMQNETRSPGLDGHAKKFSHPWVQTYFMFSGELLCLLALAFVRVQERYSSIQNGSGIPKKRGPAVCDPIFALPTICDLISSSLGGVGLLYTPASIWQMLRGARIPFSGILSVIFLKRKLHFHHWLGICVVLGGLSLVAVAGYFTDLSSNLEYTGSQVLLGIVLTLGSQIVSAIQMVLEELFVRGRNYHVLGVVGMEGLFGVIFMGLLVLPGMYFVHSDNIVAQAFQENALDAIVQIRSSSMLQLFLAFYVFSIAFYNFFGLMLTKKLSAVHRTLMDTLRTVTIWAVEVFIFYVLHTPAYALNYWSFAQLGGFTLLIVGTLMYNEILHVPFSYYPPPAPPGELEALVRAELLAAEDGLVAVGGLVVQ